MVTITTAAQQLEYKFKNISHKQVLDSLEDTHVLPSHNTTQYNYVPNNLSGILFGSSSGDETKYTDRNTRSTRKRISKPTNIATSIKRDLQTTGYTKPRRRIYRKRSRNSK